MIRARKIPGWFWLYVAFFAACFFASRAEAQTPGVFWWGWDPSITGGGVGEVVSGSLSFLDTGSCTPFNKGAAKVDTAPNYQGVFGDGNHFWGFAISCGDGTFPINSSVKVIADGSECPVGDTLNTVTGECETPQVCDGSITGTAFLRPVFSGGSTGDICHESSNCKMTAMNVTGLSGGDLVEYVGTGDDCGAEPVEEVPPSAEDTNCISSAGNTWCTEADLADQNCGYFNDDYLCLDSIPDGQCTFFGNGSMACSASAGSPPAPDDGVTPGTVATPDATINNNGSVTNIFGSGTVGTSSDPTSGSQQSDGPSTEGEEGTGTGSSSADCNVPPVCIGDAIQCAILEQEFHSGCQDIGTESEILSATGLTGLDDVDTLLGSSIGIDGALDDSGFLGAGACLLDVPVDLGFFGTHTFEFSMWCPFFAFCGVLVLISAGLTSLRIIGGAF